MFFNKYTNLDVFSTWSSQDDNFGMIGDDFVQRPKKRKC